MIPPVDIGLDASLLTLPTWTPLAAVLVGCLAGAAHAARRGFDAIGVLGLSVATGLGGLLLRDVLLQNGRSVILTDNAYLLGAAAAAVVGFFFAGLVARVNGVLTVLEAIALGVLTTVGCDAGLRAGLSWISALFLGVLTATGGLVLRDVLSGDAPSVLRPGVFTAVVAFGGASAFVGLRAWSNIPAAQIQTLTVVLVVGVRVLAVRRGWETHPALDVTNALWQRWYRLLPRRPPTSDETAR